MKEKLPVIREFPWAMNKPSCLAFCYPKCGNPFVLTGEYEFVDKFLTLNSQAIVTHYRIYDMHDTRHLYQVYGLKPEYTARITGPSRIHPITFAKGKHQRCWIEVYTKNLSRIACKPVRQIPRKWINELDSFVLSGNKIPLYSIGDSRKQNSNSSNSNSNNNILTPEQIEEAKKKELKQKKLRNSSKKTIDLLKEMGVIPTDQAVNIYEINEKNIKDIEAMHETETVK